MEFIALYQLVMWIISYRRENKLFIPEKQNQELTVTTGMNIEDRIQYQVDYNAAIKGNNTSIENNHKYDFSHKIVHLTI